ncbi:hypothetical protein [Nonomuraea sp. NPDC049607]|uniref:hypothetical protein n=1 Tax=unclassified Nonomuraea TaxID=2593643 RepID=UPI0034377BE0
MRETPEELKELETLLEASLSRSTSHLRSIVTGNTLTAEQITRIGTGDDAFDWDNDVVCCRLHPHWMTAHAPGIDKLTGGPGLDLRHGPNPDRPRAEGSGQTAA